MPDKSYSTVQSAQRALRKAGLQSLPVEFEVTPNGLLDRERFIPVLQCKHDKQVTECNLLGFKAVKLPGKVRL